MVIAPLSRDVDPGAVLLAHLFPDGDLPGEHALASTLLEEAGPALDFGRLVGRWIALRDRPFEAPEVLQALHHLADVVAVETGNCHIIRDLEPQTLTLKRRADRKDSGATIPGIGGMFDLSDSILLAAPVGYFLFKLP